jgi:hypothetical protein
LLLQTNKQYKRGDKQAMNKTEAIILAKQLFDLKQSINDNVKQWNKRFIVRTLLSKVLVDSSISYSIDEIEAMLMEI